MNEALHSLQQPGLTLPNPGVGGLKSRLSVSKYATAHDNWYQAIPLALSELGTRLS